MSTRLPLRGQRRFWQGEFTSLPDGAPSGRWAREVWGALTRAGLDAVDVDAIQLGAQEACAETSLAPGDLFGPPDRFAAERVAELNLAGAPFHRQPVLRRGALVTSLGFAAVLCLTLGITTLLTEGWHTQWTSQVPLLVVGVCVAFAATLIILTREMARRAGWQALLLAMLPALPFVGLEVWGAHHEAAWGSGSTVWWFVGAGTFAVACWGALRWLPADRPRPVPTDDWLGVLRDELRGRDDLTEAEVAARIDEVRSHLAVTHQPAGQEFGNPRGFARSLPTNRVRAQRRAAITMTVPLLVYLVVLLHRPDPALVVGGVLCLVSAVGMWVLVWRRAREARR